MWQTLLSPVLSLGKQWLSNKAETAKATHEAKIKRIAQEADWEQTMAQGSLTSLKDEFWTILLATPIIVVAYSVAFDNPLAIERLREAFVVLDGLPDWFQYLMYVSVLSSFGIRGVDKLMGLKK